MRRAESHTAPFFGHHPEDFGIPPEPERKNKEGQPIAPLNIADKMDALERLYAAWLRRPLSKWKIKLAYEPVRIFREQIHLLIRGYAQQVSELRAAQQQVEQVESNLQTIRKRQQLRNFLISYFPAETELADQRNTDLTDVSIAIMLDQKKALETSANGNGK